VREKEKRENRILFEKGTTIKGKAQASNRERESL